MVSGHVRADLRGSAAWTRVRLGVAVLVVGLGGVYYVAFTLVMMLVVVVLSIVAGKGLPGLERGVGWAGVSLSGAWCRSPARRYRRAVTR